MMSGLLFYLIIHRETRENMGRDQLLKLARSPTKSFVS